MAYRLGAFLAVVVPAVALAQTTVTTGTLTVKESTDPNNEPSAIINAAECTGTPASDNLTFFWAVTPPATDSSVQLYVANQPGCPIVNNANTGAIAASVSGMISPIPSSNSYPPSSGTTTITAAQVVTALHNAGSPVSCSAQDTPLYLCAVFSPSGTQATGPVPLQVLAPDAPTGVSATGGDSALNVSWTASGGSTSAAFYDVTAVAVDPTRDAATHDSGNVKGTSARVDGLVNNVTYNVTVVGLSSGRNPSPPSTAIQGTPVPVKDFWQLYKADGGQETGGCAAGGAGVASLLALAALLARRRRA